MKLASYISKVTEPLFIFFVLFLIGAWHAGLRGTAYYALVLVVVLASVIVHVIRLRLMRSLHINWDISDRKKRVRVFLYSLGAIGVLYACLFLWNSHALMLFATQMTVWFIGDIAITSKIKISGHIQILVLTIGYMIAWYGAAMIPLLVLIPFVGWSRLVLKRHTLVEVIGGVLYSGIFVYAVNFLLS